MAGLGERSNTGYGVVGHEPAVGATVYLTDSRQFHAATVAYWTFSTHKRNSDTKVGTAMNLEGGIGGDFFKGALTAGLAYYTEWKLGDDQIEGFQEILVRGKNKVLALGPEASIPLVWKRSVFGSVKVNYQWEVYARTTTQGSAMTILATSLVKPIKLPG